VIVIGISQGKIEEHRELKHEYNINFELLSDPALEVVRGLVAYEKENVIRKGILVDDNGHIIKEWEPLKIEKETEDVIKVIRSLLIGGYYNGFYWIARAFTNIWNCSFTIWCKKVA
jgi:peroxiredoxin Q/BCP